MLLPVRTKRNRDLTHHGVPAKDGEMNRLLLALFATAALAACDKQDHTIVSGVDHGNAVNTAGVVLPPSITASKTYRCKDNSLVYIDWLSDGAARLKTDKAARATPVKPGEPGTPTLVGDATAATVTYNGQSCRS